MIHRVLRIGRWVVDFLFSTGMYDIEAIVAMLYDFNASYSVINRASRIMESGRMNRGFTFANPDIRRALVVIGPSSSGKQFLNTFTHEVRHLADAIAKSIGYELDSEEPAYIMGDTTMALAETICKLGCDDR